MSRILKRPMFRRGGSSNEGIMTGLVDRTKHADNPFVTSIGQKAAELTPEIEALLRQYTPKTPFRPGAVGARLLRGEGFRESLINPYLDYTQRDDAREAAIKSGAVKLGIGQALKTQKKGFRILSEAEKSAIPGIDMSKTYQIDLNTNKISMLSGTGTNVTVSTPPPETQEQKDIGKVYGKEFGSIVEAGNLAIINDQKLEILRAINESPDLKTGKLGEFRTEVQKLAETFGFDPELQDTTSAEIVTGISGGLVLDGLQKFTGAISDGERNFTKSITPGLSMTREGNKYLLDISNRQNELAKGFSSFANDWVSQNGGLSKTNSEGMTWGQAKTEWHKQNPLINPEMRESLEKLSKQVDTEFSTNIFELDGKKYIYHYGVDGKKGFYSLLE